MNRRASSCAPSTQATANGSSGSFGSQLWRLNASSASRAPGSRSRSVCSTRRKSSRCGRRTCAIRFRTDLFRSTTMPSQRGRRHQRVLDKRPDVGVPDQCSGARQRRGRPRGCSRRRMACTCSPRRVRREPRGEAASSKLSRASRVAPDRRASEARSPAPTSAQTRPSPRSSAGLDRLIDGITGVIRPLRVADRAAPIGFVVVVVVWIVCHGPTLLPNVEPQRRSEGLQHSCG